MSNTFRVKIVITGGREQQRAATELAKTVVRLEDLETELVNGNTVWHCYTQGSPVSSDVPEEDRPCYYPPAGEVYTLSLGCPDLVFAVETFDLLNGTLATFSMHNGFVGNGKLIEFGCSESGYSGNYEADYSESPYSEEDIEQLFAEKSAVVNLNMGPKSSFTPPLGHKVPVCERTYGII